MNAWHFMGWMTGVIVVWALTETAYLKWRRNRAEREYSLEEWEHAIRTKPRNQERVFEAKESGTVRRREGKALKPWNIPPAESKALFDQVYSAVPVDDDELADARPAREPKRRVTR